MMKIPMKYTTLLPNPLNTLDYSPYTFSIHPPQHAYAFILSSRKGDQVNLLHFSYKLFLRSYFLNFRLCIFLHTKVQEFHQE